MFIMVLFYHLKGKAPGSNEGGEIAQPGAMPIISHYWQESQCKRSIGSTGH